MADDHLRAVPCPSDLRAPAKLRGIILDRSARRGGCRFSCACAFGKAPNCAVSSFRAPAQCRSAAGSNPRHGMHRRTPFSLCCDGNPGVGASAACSPQAQCREVACQVQTISWRERRILASILVNADEQSVWEVLTDYERLAEFIPNLLWSERIPCPHPGRIWLLQRGIQRAMYWHIEAQVVLDLRELPNLENGKELHFFMVDGDFKRYEGKWCLRPGPRSNTTILHYEVNVIPRVFLPALFVERIIKSDLPVNLCALAERAEGIHNAPEKDSSVNSVCNGENPNANFSSAHTLQQEARHPDQPTKTKVEVHKPSSDSKESAVLSDWGDGENLLRTRFQGISKVDRRCLADEIHFRRLDDLLDNEGVHRQVLATITVKAPPEEVWAVLTAYEDLPEFVPNLANSKVVSKEGKKVRLVQEGCKCLLYMALHARVVLDLWEQPGYEITFKQVEGDFDSFQGRWALKQFGSQHTLMKYMVETRIRKDCVLSEAIVEEVIYEDLPSNLCAIRDRVEMLKQRTANSTTEIPTEFATKFPETPELVSFHAEEMYNEGIEGKVNSDARSVFKKRKKKLVPLGAREDFGILEKELMTFIAKYGKDGVMPMRKSLRHYHRIDLERAITGMGGFRAVAARFKLSLAYKRQKPKGYWDNLDNLKQEIISFQLKNDIDRGTMPTRRSIEKQGRYDLARAFEKWGGLREAARILGLRREKRKS